MKLRSLRIQGFKSFADRTTIEFRDGVTAIVGSNGCGKSNTADAVRWVLGEQRASAVRSARMDEVIFQGTTKRRPLNYAEVSLLFSNEDGRVPIPQSEIELTRKVFREGGSEYALNRTACRLKDIHSLLRDTGLGSNAYAIIEGTMIETLLSDRAEERRALFEEAAGIGRYKDSRHATLRRLEGAEGDLARLGDLIAEVEAKVRTLSRQRRKAQRHRELQDRRLDLEIALAHADLRVLGEELRAGERRLRELRDVEVQARTERSVAEAVSEEHRAETAGLSQRRVQVAGRLEEVRRRLDAREREVLLAEERRGHAEMRLAQLVQERGSLRAREEQLSAELARASAELAEAAGRLDAIRARAEDREEENRALRAAVAAQRTASEEAAAASRDVARQIAAAEGERTASELRRREVEERIGRLEERRRALGGEVDELSAQTELWETRSGELRGRLDAAEEAVERTREGIRVLQGREAEARRALREAEDRLSRLAAQVAAREAVERSYEGFTPAVAAVMALRERFPGVHGPLADFVESGADAAHMRGVEDFLGTLLQALVVDDLEAARAIRDWFREEWRGGGSLFLLPLDAPAVTARRGTGTGTGAPWVRALLDELGPVGVGDPLSTHDAGARVGLNGEVVDARGIIRLSEQGSGEGILERRRALASLREELAAADSARAARLAERQALEESLAGAEESAREAEELRRAAAGELQRIEADAAARGHHRDRLRRDQEELERSAASLRAAATDAAERLVEVERRLGGLTARVEETAAAAEAARGRLEALEERWEGARDEESELRVATARAEGEVRELERRIAAAEQGMGGARGRGRTVEAEAAELQAALEGLSGVRERAAEEIEELFRDRDREAGELAAVDGRLAEVDASVAELTERVRVSRRRESESGEEAHRLELRLAEARSRLERVRERLEAEWGRPWEALEAAARPVEEGDPELWAEELRELARQLESLGPVNMLAVEEHEEEERRLNFLLAQRDDLVKARDDLSAAIRQINKTAREVFLATFEQVRENFRRTFHSLFQGGECDVWLADPDDPLESPVEIQASPKGKRTQRIHLLSGGERTLTALALLFALYLVKPSPFCVLDEVDAPLDESNVGRFIQLLQDFKAETQFVVITHNPRTMEAADWIYGVTMEEPGVSTIVGVELLGKFGLEGRVA